MRLPRKQGYAMTDLFSVLSAVVRQASALRVIVRLRPAMSDGLVYPPTYDKGQQRWAPPIFSIIRRYRNGGPCPPYVLARHQLNAESHLNQLRS